MVTRCFRVGASALVLLSVFTLASCSKGIDGKYAAPGNVMTIEFKGGKAIVAIAGESKTLDYSMDGDKITIQSPDKGDTPMVLTRMADGSLQGPNGVTLKKTAT
jgi:hypothetical protein